MCSINSRSVEKNPEKGKMYREKKNSSYYITKKVENWRKGTLYYPFPVPYTSLDIAFCF